MAKNGLHLLTPTSTAVTGSGSSATINTNGSVTFSSCATLSLNGVFSADYDNYMIVMRSTPSVADNYRMRLRASGSDASGSDYVRQTLYANGTSVTAGRATETSNLLMQAYNTQRVGFILYCYGPYLAQPTATRSVTAGDYTSADLYDVAATHSLSTQYDGFTFFPQTSGTTVGGLVGVYGMRK